MGVEGHPAQCGHSLSLASGGDDADFLFRQGFNVIQIHQHAVRDIHIPQLGGDLHIILHAPPGHSHPPSVACRHINNLLEPVHVRREGRHNDTLRTPAEQRVKARTYAAFAACITGPVHISRIRQERQNTLIAQLPKPRQVDHTALNGGGVDLKVAGVDAHPGRRPNRKRDRVRNRVVHVDELHTELPGTNHVSGLTGHNFRFIQQPVFLQLQANQPSAHPRGIDRRVDRPQHIGQRTDVVLVSVGDKDTPNFVLIFNQVAHVGNHHVDPVHIVVRKAHTAVHDDNVVSALIHGQIFPDFVQTAQRNDFQFVCHRITPFLLH